MNEGSQGVLTLSKRRLERGHACSRDNCGSGDQLLAVKELHVSARDRIA